MSNSVSQSDQSTVRSPCVSNCCLDHDDVCMGCFRHIDEITGWHSADITRKKQILENTSLRRATKGVSSQ